MGPFRVDFPRRNEPKHEKSRSEQCGGHEEDRANRQKVSARPHCGSGKSIADGGETGITAEPVWMSATKKTNQSNPRALRCVGPADGSFCIGPVTIYVQRVRFVQPPPYPPPLAGEGREGDGRSTRRRNGFAGGELRQRDCC